MRIMHCFQHILTTKVELVKTKIPFYGTRVFIMETESVGVSDAKKKSKVNEGNSGSWNER